MDANTVYEMVMGAITEDELQKSTQKYRMSFQKTQNVTGCMEKYMRPSSISAKNYINQEKKILMWN